MADIVGEMTNRLLVDSGIGTGMRVLDVGCGRGDVSILAARLVGEQGQVLGIDRDARPLAAARERVRELGLANIDFIEGDFCTIPPERDGFDAAVGRRVLMYQPDPVDAVRRLTRAVRPGGLVIFQEHDSTMSGCMTLLPLHERVRGWIWRTVEQEGANVHMGFDLAAVLERAGLTVEQVRAEAIVQTPKAHYAVGAIVRAMLPRIVKQGIANEDEIAVETLDRRLIEEREKANATYIGEMVFGAWARKGNA
jgi:SAM-dependent methyltransferase